MAKELMVKKNFYITPQQQEKLVKLVKEKGLSESEILRNALSKYFDEEK